MKKHLIPYWNYDPNDITTWKYICEQQTNPHRKKNLRWILNPEFKYKHLDPLNNDHERNDFININQGALNMAIQQFTINFVGQNNIVPRIGHLYAPDNTLAEVAAAGFLDEYIQSQGFSVVETDVIIARASDGAQWYKPVFTLGSCQLTVLP